MARFNVAIDGTSGVGKSTVADILAERNGMVHLDTGAMYRCVALALSREKADLENPEGLQAVLRDIRIAFDGKRVFLNGEEVTDEIRLPEISKLTSAVSALGPVRKAMGQLQRDVCASGGYLVDGRDIGTVILPEAPVKIFLSASPEARAKRRYDEYVSKGVPAVYEEILSDIEARDWNDTHRAISPLKKAEDAVEIDTSDMGIEEVVQAIQDLMDKEASIHD